MLITQAIDEARSCTEFVQTPELPRWCFRYHRQSDEYYPCCIKCGVFLSPKHYTSKKHQELCSGVRTAFDCPPMPNLCTMGVKLYLSDNTQNTVTFASATDWLSANIDPSVDHSIPPVQYTVNGNTKYGEFRGVANVKGGTQEKMPNCGLPRQGDI